MKKKHLKKLEAVEALLFDLSNAALMDNRLDYHLISAMQSILISLLAADRAKSF